MIIPLLMRFSPELWKFSIFTYKGILQSTKFSPVIWQLIAFSPKCASLPNGVRYADAEVTTFSSMSFEILIPDLWMNRSINLQDVCICCKSPLMNRRDKSISWTLTSSRDPASLQWTWPAMVLVVVHASCLSKFLHHTCDNVPNGNLSGYSLKLPPDIVGETLAKSISWSWTLSPMIWSKQSILV